MLVTSGSSGPSTRIGASSLTSCFNCIGTSKVSSGLRGRQRVGSAGFGDRLSRFRGRFGRRRHVRAKAEIRGGAFGNSPENRCGRFAAVIAFRVRFIEIHSDAQLRIIGGKETDEGSKVFM